MTTRLRHSVIPMNLRTSLLLVLAPAVLAAGSGGPSKEATPVFLLQTGGEDGLKGWRERGPAEFATDPAERHGGRQAARITVRPGAELHYQQLQFDVDARPGDEYRVAVWVRTRGAADGTGAYAALEYLDDREQRTGIDHSQVGLTNGRDGWEQLTIHGAAPKGTTRARFALILHAHGTAWFDDAEIVRVDRLEPWPHLGTAERRIIIHVGDVVQPRFGGVGFHVFDHAFPTTKAHLDQVIIKRWRELNPSFARLNDNWDWDQATRDRLGDYLLRMKETGTEVYLTTWNPKDTPEGPERVAYAKRVVDNLEYLVRARGATNLKSYCMTNELSMKTWGALRGDLPKFRAYHQRIVDELRARKLEIQHLATDASPVEWWDTIEWATQNMDAITGIYGGHHYFNNQPPDDERFYPWFLGRMHWGVGLARSVKKDFILGEFGCRQDGRTVDGVKLDVCVYWGTPLEPLVGIQLAEAALAGLNAGAYALGYWTFCDLPDTRSRTYGKRWGLFKWSGTDYSTRAPYYAYGLLTKFFRGPATVFRVETSDPRLRAAAVRHHERNSWSILVVNRNQSDVPVAVALYGSPLSAVFRKYVYDPRNVPQNPFGDLQPPAGAIAMKDGRLADTVAAGTLAVYTTAYDDQPPAPVRGLAVERSPDGKPLFRWQPSPERDLCYYRVFASPQPDFVPSLATQIGSTTAAEFPHEAAVPGTAYYYKVLAVDQSGNTSQER